MILKENIHSPSLNNEHGGGEEIKEIKINQLTQTIRAHYYKIISLGHAMTG